MLIDSLFFEHFRIDDKYKVFMAIIKWNVPAKYLFLIIPLQGMR